MTARDWEGIFLVVLDLLVLQTDPTWWN